MDLHLVLVTMGEADDRHVVADPGDGDLLFAEPQCAALAIAQVRDVEDLAVVPEEHGVVMSQMDRRAVFRDPGELVLACRGADHDQGGALLFRAEERQKY